MGRLDSLRGFVDAATTFRFKGSATVVFEGPQQFNAFRSNFCDLDKGPLAVNTDTFTVYQITTPEGSPRILGRGVREFTALCDAHVMGTGAKSTTTFAVEEEGDTFLLSSEKTTLHLPGGVSLSAGFLNQIGIVFEEGTRNKKPKVNATVQLETRNPFIAPVAKRVLGAIRNPQAYVQEGAQKIANAITAC